MALVARRFILAGESRNAGIATGGADLGTWPGQAGNRVGFANTPASPPSSWSGGGTWPGAYPGSLTPMAWSAGVPPTATSGPAWGSGTAGNPTIIAFRDFDTGIVDNTYYAVSLDGQSPGSPVNHVRFVGCRFQLNDNVHYGVECFRSGSTDIGFLYCSITPRASLWPSPKGFTRWPSAGALTGAFTDGTSGTATLRDPYMIPYADGYLFAINVAANGGGVVTVDHCDIWGGGFGISTANTGVGQLIITDNWVHDARNDNNDADHTDGIGNASGNFVDANVIVQHNTIASIGTTRGGSWQRAADFWVSGTSYPQFFYATDPSNHLCYFALNFIASSTVQPHLDPTNWQQNGNGFYSNYQVLNNYFSGYFNTIDAFGRQAGQTPFGTGLVFTDNIWATDLNCVASPLYQDQQAQFNVINFNSTWRRNKMLLVPGDNWSSTFLDTASQPISNYSGQFLLPVRNISNTWATMFSTSDWAN